MNRLAKRLLSILMALIKMISIPAVVYVVFALICRLRGIEGFGTGSDLIVILRTTVQTGMIALAVSYNLTSGRFDFSVGSILILSTMLGASLTVNYQLGPSAMLLISIAIGVVLGTVSGLVYIWLRLPPMIVSLGITMIYEAVGFVYTNGAGVRLFGRDDLLIWASPPFFLIIAAIVLPILFIILNYTQFGYETNALRSGQAIAVSVGVDEKKNAVICYAIAGGLLAIAGIIHISILGRATPALGLSSVAHIENAFLPMFIGIVLARHGDRNLGVLIGALTQSIIISAFGRLGIPTQTQTVLNGLIVIAFFAYSFNYHRIVEYRMFKKKLDSIQKDTSAIITGY